jgi:hypothetical protein
MVFYESGNIDNLFRGIEKLVGIPIEHIVIESRRRETRGYIQRIYSASLKEAVELTREGLREGSLPHHSAVKQKLLEAAREINISINNIGRVYGYGDIVPSEGWEKGENYPWRTQVVRHPYSLLFYTADMLGSVEAIEDSDHRVEYRDIGGDAYEVSSYPGGHLIELTERLQRQKYDFKAGDISYERCPGCGLPVEINRCSWDLNAGTITDPETGRRMAIFGPGSLDAILNDLETELGEAIPEAVVAAQRDYIKENMREESWKKDALSFRRMIAARGLGNLIRFEGGRKSLHATIENSCLHLLMVGATQAMVEMVYGVDGSTYEWELAEDGDLDMTIRL